MESRKDEEVEKWGDNTLSLHWDEMNQLLINTPFKINI